MTYSISGVFSSFIDILKRSYVPSLKHGFFLYFLPVIILQSLLAVLFPQLSALGMEAEVATWSQMLSLVSFEVLIGLFSLLLSACLFLIATNRLSDSVFSQSLALGLKFLLVGLLWLAILAIAGILIVLLVLAELWVLAILLGLLAVLGLVVLYVFVSVYPVELAHGKPVIEGVLSSIRLVRKEFWMVVATYLVVMVVLFAVMLVFVVVSLLGSAALMLVFLASPVIAAILQAVISAVIVVLISPIGVSFITAVHGQLSE